MLIDNSEQLQAFLKSISKEIPDNKVIKEIESVIDVDRIQTFSKKMLLLQWYFYQGDDSFSTDKVMYDNALNEKNENGLIQKLPIKLTLAINKDDWGKENARSEMIKLAKQDILIHKDNKNYVITDIGNICAKFLFYKVLEKKLNIAKMWSLIKTELTELNLQNLDPEINILDLQDWFILIKEEDNYAFHPKFIELIDFLRDHPELYPKEFNIIIDNLFFWIKNTIICDLDKIDVRLTLSNKKIQQYKDNLKEIDWIYRITCKYDHQALDLHHWLKSEKIDHIFGLSKKGSKLREFILNCLIIISPPGYGKSILVYQFCLDILGKINQDDGLIIPILLNSKNFNIRSGYLYYKDLELFETEKYADNDLNRQQISKFSSKLIEACLSDYKTNDLMVRLFSSALSRVERVVIIDGWDELEPTIRQILRNYIKKILEIKSKEENINLKIFITSRYLDSFLQSLAPKKEDDFSRRSISVSLELPKEEDIYTYLNLLSKLFKNKDAIKELKKNFHGTLTPLDLFLIGIFPLMDIPKYKIQLFERWIYYQALSEIFTSNDFKHLKTEEDIRVKLESHQLIRDLDTKNYYLAQLIDGVLKGDDEYNYALLDILPRIAYSFFKPEIERPINYITAINNNPLLKRFIRPYYKGFQSYAQLADPHFYAYFIAKLIFLKFLKDEEIEPLPYQDVEDFIMEFYLHNQNDPKISRLGVSRPENFVCYLYLQSGIVLPTLNLPYNYGGLVSLSLGSQSLKYGVYLLKAFQFEFKKVIKENNKKRKQTILDIFDKYRNERPTRTIGSYMDEYSHEFDVGEPMINHQPNYYFDSIIGLLGLDIYTKKTKQEIEYLNLEEEYFLGERFAKSYWKKKDLIEILQFLINSDNHYIFPWLIKVISFFQKNGLILDFNFDMIIEKYKTIEDEYVQNSLIELLIQLDSIKVLEESELFLKENNIDNLESLISPLCEFIQSRGMLKKNLFGLWINYYSNPHASIKQRYKLVRALYSAELSDKEIILLSKIYKNGPSFTIKYRDEEFDDRYQKPDEDPRELNYIFNCLLLLKYHKNIIHKAENKYDLIGDYDLLIKYALEKRRFHYIDLIRTSGIISDDDLEQKMLYLEFNHIFSYSKVILDHNYFNRQYFKEIKVYLKDTHNFLLNIQQKWLEKRAPNSIYRIKSMIKELFKFYIEKKDTWTHYTDLGGAYVAHSNEENNPEIIQLNALFLVIEKHFSEMKLEIAKYFFKQFEENILLKINTEDNDPYYFYNQDIPLFIKIAFRKYQNLPTDIKLEWIRTLIEHQIPFDSFKVLFKDIPDFSKLHDDIWDRYGKKWVGRKDFYFRKRPYSLSHDKEEEDSDIPSNVLFLLPFDLLLKKLKEELKWESLMADYHQLIYQNYQEEFYNQGTHKKLIEKFGKRIQLFTLKLTEIAKYNKYESKALNLIAKLWEKYYIYPLISEREHPSYNIYWNLVGDLAQNVYDKIKDPVAKVIFNLCRFERYLSISESEIISELLNNFNTFKKNDIAIALEKLEKSDWRIEHKFLLLLFSEYSIKTLPMLSQILEACSKELSNRIEWYNKPRVRANGIQYNKPIEPIEKTLPFKDLICNHVLFDINILKNYTLFTEFLHVEIPEHNIMESIFRDYKDEQFGAVIKEIRKFERSEMSIALESIDIKPLINSELFQNVYDDYMDFYKKYEQIRNPDRKYYNSPFRREILNYFIINKKDTIEFEDLIYNPPSTIPHEHYEYKIKDSEVQEVFNKVKIGDYESDELIEFLNRKGITKDTTSILTHIIPFYYIDSVDFMYSRDPPQLIERYQNRIFHFLVRLLYQEENNTERIVKIESRDYSNYYDDSNSDYYYFEKDISEYLTHLIFYGIYHNKLNEWYASFPEDIDRNWMKNRIDSIIVSQMYIPSHVNNLPEHLKIFGRDHAWKYMILPDLVNEIEKYFEGYRNTFPNEDTEEDQEDEPYEDYTWNI